jgi:hypothetical protein
VEIEPALGLDDFSGAYFAGRPRNRPADLRVVEIRRKVEGLREEAIAEQNAKRISPSGIHRGLGPPPFGFVHDVVVHEGGDMNQLNDHREIDMT